MLITLRRVFGNSIMSLPVHFYRMLANYVPDLPAGMLG
jgi:hypothetical protein